MTLFAPLAYIAGHTQFAMGYAGQRIGRSGMALDTQYPSWSWFWPRSWFRVTRATQLQDVGATPKPADWDHVR